MPGKILPKTQDEERYDEKAGSGTDDSRIFVCVLFDRLRK